MDTRTVELPPDSDSAAVPTKSARVSVRALLFAIAFSLITALWVRQAELLVVAAQVSESVPPIPALAALILLVGLNPLLRALGPRFGLSRQEQIVIYCFVTVTAAICGPGTIRFLLMFLTTPFHYAAPGNTLGTVQHLIPSWLAVSDPAAISGYFRGSPSGVPWHLWLVPVLSWSVFLLVLWAAMLCLALLARNRWIEGEQLAFPLVKLPLEMTSGTDLGMTANFFRNRLMWLGFGLAALYNGVNILHALVPWVPAAGTFYDLDGALTDAPWSSLKPLMLQYQPELVGFGFLMPTEICFSIWFFFLLSRAEAMFAFTHAFAVADVPFEQEQSMGAFLVLGVWFLWQLRHDLLRPVRPGQPLGLPRGPLIGLVISVLFLGWFCVSAGMQPWVAVAYLTILLLTALVSARIRADAGAPLIWLFPFYQQKKVLLNLLGTAPFASTTMPGTLAIFALLAFLSRGYFPALIGYQIDGLKMAEEVRLPRRQMAGVLLFAAVVGIGLAFWVHLSTFYAHGAENIGGGLWGDDTTIQELSQVGVPQPPDGMRTTATCFGGLLTIGLLVARQLLVHFPLHPLGYALATAYGGFVWWSFFVVWALKAAILRWGGVKMYREAIPLFLGFALGHFFVAGIVWGLIGAFWPDAARAYGVWFG